MRFLARFVYLAASLWWAFLMVRTQSLRCDDSCVARPQEWRDDVNAWQYGVVGWLGAAGLLLAIIAVALRRGFGVMAVLVHGAVFTANCLILYLGRSIYGTFIPFALGATVVFAAGLSATGGLPRKVR
jgi:hypothetical protein